MNALARDTLATLIGSRICHDLISPIGAINNGLELIGMSGQPLTPELSLIQDSVRHASARIRLFRIAFGAPVGQDLSEQEIRTILQDVSADTRVEVVYHPIGARPRSDVRMVYLAVMCLETALAYGGTIHIECRNGDWTVTGTGPRPIRDDDLWANPEGLAQGLSVAPAHVQFVLLPLIAQDNDRVLQITHQNTQMRISITRA